MTSSPNSATSKGLFGTKLYQEYQKLPKFFYSPATPTPVSAPRWILRNNALAQELGIDQQDFAAPEALQILAGNVLPEGITPIAQAYSGHQFGYFNPQLGDGRAILLGEIRATNGLLYDVQLKGAGPTAYSRSGDGRSAIGPVIREFIVSEAMHRLGVPTTRSLAAIATGDMVRRNGAVPGGVLTRIARSHVRVGTFEYFAAQGRHDACKQLVQWVIHRHYEDLIDSSRPAHDLLMRVAEQQASLIAQWMSIGFIHGVMNTDNSAVSGHTIDYGPCAFLDEFKHSKVFSSIDAGGRYAYGNQPHIGAWNVMCLGQALLPLLNQHEAPHQAGNGEQAIQDAIDHFAKTYERCRQDRFCHKLGFQTAVNDDQLQLIEDFLALLEHDAVDFTIAFRTLSSTLPLPQSPTEPPAVLTELFPTQAAAITRWYKAWIAALQLQNISHEEIKQHMEQTNPAYIPRNHLLAQVIAQAENGEFDAAVEMHQALQTPYQESSAHQRFAQPPKVEERVLKTFCGT